MESTCATDINKPNNTKEQKNGAKGPELCLPYDVLRIIFKYLNGMDLSSASIVCSMWLKAATDEKHRRGPVCITEDVALNTSNEAPDPWDLKYNREEIIRNLQIKPKVAIFLDIFDAEDCPGNTLPVDCYSVTLTFYSPYPEDSSFTSSESSYDNDRSFESDDLDWDVSFGEPHAFGAFLPDIPEVKIKTLHVLEDPNHIEESIKKFQHSIVQALKKPKCHGKVSRCVLLFSALPQYPKITKFVKSFNRCHPEKLCLWGGTAYEIIIHNAHHGKKRHLCGEYALCVGIVMTGAFDCWCMVMDETHKTEKLIEKKLMELKEKVHLKRHSMGFMFTACKPSINSYAINDRKTKYFNQIFPRMPLLECLGNTMFGSDTIGESSESKDKCWSMSSTVFMIITYG